MDTNHNSLREQSHAILLYAPESCAFRTLTYPQKLFLTLLLILVALWLSLQPFTALLLINIVLVSFYILFSLYKLLLINLSVIRKEPPSPAPEEVEALDESLLPVYTILVPLFREERSLPQLVRGIMALDYPKEKLDVKLLLEENDTPTIEACKKLHLKEPFEMLVVPDSLPKTKPKACNYGLYRSRGKFLVIYDAEDLPEPDQLKKAVALFARTPKEVVCLQARLNFYNSRQNLLAKWFTAEYSMWFDLYLPGLCAVDAPIPLGGTSNHFLADELKKMYGWDPYNVTEDCDLGIRLYGLGKRTMMLDSTTWEEACASPGGWFRQRSRWVKGYIQTYLVHNRRPFHSLKTLGFMGWFHFHMVVGGMFFCFLINPFYWILTLIWFATRWHTVSLLFPALIFFLGALCLFLGNFIFIYICALGVYRRRYFDLVKYALLVPPYWLMISLAAWKGFFQLITNPFYWEKTEHGFAHPEGSHETAIPKNQ